MQQDLRAKSGCIMFHEETCDKFREDKYLDKLSFTKESKNIQRVSRRKISQ